MELIGKNFEKDLPELKFLGRGPSQTGSNGWRIDRKFYYRCASCGDVMKASNEDYWKCTCGAMILDPDAARFGSQFGDENILVYRNCGKNKGLLQRIKNALQQPIKTMLK